VNTKTVAAIGATEAPGSVGRTLLRNLTSSSFGGTVFPVNQMRSSVLGIQTFATVTAIPAQVDLAPVARPAATVPQVIRECADAGVAAAVIVTAGFRETGFQVRYSCEEEAVQAKVTL
jgi:acetyltransferase